MVAIIKREGTLLGELEVKELEASLDGSVILPGDDDYDTERALWNAASDNYPAVILQVESTNDVLRGVRFARQHRMPLSMKGGGHNAAGTGMAHNGLAIVFSRMKSVRIDPVQRMAYVQPGAVWADFYRAASEHGLVTPGGLMPTVGVAGFTLGGGISILSRRHGLTADNLVSAQVVTADGQLLTASADENPDLLWALKGGGGNFGVVTEFTFALHPISAVLRGTLTFPMPSAVEALKSFRDVAAGAPEDLGMLAMLHKVPNVGPALTILVVYTGDKESGERVIAPLRKVNPVLHDSIKSESFFTPPPPGPPAPHACHYGKSGYIKDLTDEAIETLVAHFNTATAPATRLHIMALGGKISTVEAGATAYPHREAPFIVEFITGWGPDETETQDHIAWADAGLEEAQPYMTGGVYVNFLGNEGAERVRAAYGDNYSRLAELKEKYDPTNFFSLNQNIEPAGK